MKKIEKEVFKIVVTGGPCAGKTTILNKIQEEFTKKGYSVLIVPETATELISNGIKPFGNCLDNYEFQDILLQKQLHKETLYNKVANLVPEEKVIIIYDRGLLDAQAYLEKEDFDILLNNYGLSEISIMDRYDLIIHLVTAARGAEHAYTLENNESRTETPEMARVLDSKTLSCWVGHPKLRIIDNSTTFELKISRSMQEIYSLLGAPIPLEIERKYLIEMPNLEEIVQEQNAKVLDIVQHYLTSNGETERRIRQVSYAGEFIYSYTEKRKISELERIEVERRISSKEYVSLLSQVDNNLHPIIKKRYCFTYLNQYFELDIFSFSHRKAILEIELTSKNKEVSLPPFLNILQDVTDLSLFKNYNIAQFLTI